MYFSRFTFDPYIGRYHIVRICFFIIRKGINENIIFINVINETFYQNIVLLLFEKNNLCGGRIECASDITNIDSQLKHVLYKKQIYM